MAKKDEETIDIELSYEYSFGKTVTLHQLTLAEETQIEKKSIANDGAGSGLYGVMASCGLTEDEAGSLKAKDARKIFKAQENF